ncbi:hypothetical protein XENOCAPTIV_009104 [Xenoophorus captivus]|uniref:Uncharacterized protein n=1 Tax=Xenoophorus captivus TaxID=1517983 RepID=A0ABV0QE06_9TELE
MEELDAYMFSLQLLCMLRPSHHLSPCSLVLELSSGSSITFLLQSSNYSSPSFLLSFIFIFTSFSFFLTRLLVSHHFYSSWVHPGCIQVLLVAFFLPLSSFNINESLI